MVSLPIILSILNALLFRLGERHDTVGFGSGVDVFIDSFLISADCITVVCIGSGWLAFSNWFLLKSVGSSTSDGVPSLSSTEIG